MEVGEKVYASCGQADNEEVRDHMYEGDSYIGHPLLSTVRRFSSPEHLSSRASLYADKENNKARWFLDQEDSCCSRVENSSDQVAKKSLQSQMAIEDGHSIPNGLPFRSQ